LYIYVIIKINMGDPQPISRDIGERHPAGEIPFWMTAEKPPEIRLKEELSTRGATAVVYKGEILSLEGEHNEVAVKIPRDRREYREAVVGEADILDRLRAKQQELFPDSPSHFVYGKVMQVNGKPSLVMELIPERARISTRTFISYNGQGIFDEDIANGAQSIVRQSFETIVIEDAAGLITSDRKSGDYFYLPQSDRLVVLDWNTNNKSLTPKGAITTLIANLRGNMGKYLPEGIRQKLDKIEKRAAAPYSIVEPRKVLELINQEQVSDAQIETAMPIDKQLEAKNRWRQVLENKPLVIKEINNLLTGMAEGRSEDGTRIPEILADSYAEEQQPFIDFIRFTSDFADFRHIPQHYEKIEEVYHSKWRKEFHTDAIAFLNNPAEANEELKARLKSKLRQLLSDEYIKTNYFDTGGSPIPAEFQHLIE